MKLILLSTAEFFVEEDKIINALFDEGLDLLHLRKPQTEPVYSERLLTLLPPECHSRIVVHEHFYLKEEFNLRGIHLSAAHPEPPSGFHGQISRSVHSLDELKNAREGMDYVFLSPIFDSISYPDRHAGYTSQQLYDAARAGLIDRKVMAAGGISSETLPLLSDYGFGGAVVSGDLWHRFNIHSGLDYKEVIAHFRKLRKAAG
ncbi:MAG: thiamine phosphate synthase [Bacteroidaceae bacterium]|nr:thiamine phosphate synthase [Bacteroidaceae bacterium]